MSAAPVLKGFADGGACFGCRRKVEYSEAGKRNGEAVSIYALRRDFTSHTQKPRIFVLQLQPQLQGFRAPQFGPFLPRLKHRLRVRRSGESFNQASQTPSFCCLTCNYLLKMAPDSRRRNSQATSAEISIVHLKNCLVNLPSSLCSLLINSNAVCS
jgi:hypothetical protein